MLLTRSNRPPAQSPRLPPAPNPPNLTKHRLNQNKLPLEYKNQSRTKECCVTVPHFEVILKTISKRFFLFPHHLMFCQQHRPSPCSPRQTGKLPCRRTPTNQPQTARRTGCVPQLLPPKALPSWLFTYLETQENQSILKIKVHS